MFDPDYRKSPWNRSSFAPKNGGSKTKKGKGNEVTRRASLPMVAIGALIFLGMIFTGNFGSNFIGLIFIYMIASAIITPFYARHIREKEYNRLVESAIPQRESAYQNQHYTETIEQPSVGILSTLWRIVKSVVGATALCFLGLFIVTMVYTTQTNDTNIEVSGWVTAISCLAWTALLVVLWIQSKPKHTRVITPTPERYKFDNPVPIQPDYFDFEVSELPPSMRHVDNSTLDPSVFEEEVAWIINATTQQTAKVVGGSGDGGVDIEVFDRHGIRVGIVQCKRYDPNKALPPLYVRELFAVKMRLNVPFAYLATTAYFTDKTKHEAKEFGIRLIDGNTIRKMQKKAQHQMFKRPKK